MAEQEHESSNSWELTSWSANRSGVWRRKGMRWGGREREQRISKVFWNAKAHSTDVPTPVMSHCLIILKLLHQPGINPWGPFSYKPSQEPPKEPWLSIVPDCVARSCRIKAMPLLIPTFSVESYLCYHYVLSVLHWSRD